MLGRLQPNEHLRRITSLLETPKLDDDEQARLARLLEAISVGILVAFIIAGATVPLTTPTPVPPLASAAVGILLQTCVLVLMRHRRIRLASLLITFSLWVIITAISPLFGGISSPIIGGYAIVVLVAGMLLGGRAGLLFALLSTAGVGFILINDVNPLLPWPSSAVTPVSALVTYTAIIGATALLLFLATRNLGDALRRARLNERAQKQANQELATVRADLEERVAELERTQRRLVDSERLYQDLVQSLPQAVFRKDLQGHFSFANDKFCQDFGPSSAVVGKTDHELFPQPVADRHCAQDEFVLHSGVRSENTEIREWDNGEVSYLHVIKTPTFDSSGNPSGIQGIIWDITRLVQAEEQVRQSRDDLEKQVRDRTAQLAQERNLLRTLLDNLPDAIYVLDTTGHYVVVNAAEARRVGVPASEAMIGKHPSDLVAPGIAERQIADDRRLLETGQSVVGREDVYVDPRTGIPAWYLTTKVPLLDGTGQLIGLVGIAHDITIRKNAEQALAASEGRLRAIVEGTQALLVTVDTRGRLTYANQAAAKAIGFSEIGELTGKRFLRFIHPDDRKRAIGTYLKQIATLRPSVTLEYQIRDTAGQVKWFSFVTDLIMADGRVTGLSGVGYDITKRKWSEWEILRRNRELAALNRVGHALGRLAAPAEIVELLGVVVGQVLDNRNLYVALVDDQTGKITFPLYTMDGTRLLETLAREFGDGLTEYVLNTRRPLLISEGVEAEGKRLGFVANGRLPQSLLAVPIIAGAKALGVVAVQDYSRAHAFNTDHMQLLSTIASQAAIALENARLFGAVQAELSERKRAEESLAHERNLLRTLIDSIPDSIFVKDAASRYLVTNQAHARALGVASPAEAVGKTDHDCLVPLLATQYEAIDQAVMLSGKPMISREIQVIDPATGKSGWGLTTKVPLRDNTGRIVGLVGVNRNITKLKLVEETLRLQTGHLEIAALVARTVTSKLDIDDILPRVVALIREQFGYYQVSVFLNDADDEWSILTAQSVESAGTQPVPDVRARIGGPSMVGWVTRMGQPRVAPDVSQDPAFRAEPLLPETRSEVAVPLAIGDAIIGALDAQSKSLDGFSPEAVSILTTIADQIAIAIQNTRLHSAEKQRSHELEMAYRALQVNQAQLLAAEKMASLGRLTAGIAHEMNTPLAAVRAALAEAAQLANEFRASLGDPEVTPQDYSQMTLEMSHALDVATRASKRVAGFVRSVKSQTRGMSSVEPQRFGATTVIEEALLLMHHAARRTGCTVTFEHPDEAFELNGFPGRLAQVVTNLVENAIDASAPLGGGPVIVRLAQIAGGYELQVADRGTGIAPEVLPKIFEPMFTTKPFGEGTGLGLAIVHDIVTGDLNGTIDVATGTGLGTTFTIRFPDLQESQHADRTQN